MTLTVNGEITQPHRSVFQAMKRGFAGRCPNCGEGKLFAAFIKPVDACSACGEELHHHRADDLPPYLNIFVVGHIVVGGFTLVEVMTDWPGWLHIAIWGPLMIGMALLLMQPIKGAVIGQQVFLMRA